MLQRFVTLLLMGLILVSVPCQAASYYSTPTTSTESKNRSWDVTIETSSADFDSAELEMNKIPVPPIGWDSGAIATTPSLTEEIILEAAERCPTELCPNRFLDRGPPLA